MKALFVGGHWHGRTHDVPSRYPAFKVAVPRQLSPSIFWSDVEPEIQTYYRRRAVVGLGVIETFVLDGNPDDVGMADALVIAAGLEAKR